MKPLAIYLFFISLLVLSYFNNLRAHTPNLYIKPGAVIVCDHVTLENTRQAKDATTTVLQGIAESCTHLTDVVIEKDKKKKKRSFFRLLCSLFNTVVTIIANQKNTKKSLEQFEDYNTDIAHLTCDFLAIIKHEPTKTIRFTRQPSYLYQISFMNNPADQEQAIMNFLQSPARDLFITELCDELQNFMNSSLLTEIIETSE